MEDTIQIATDLLYPSLEDGFEHIALLMSIAATGNNDLIEELNGTR